MGTVIDYVIFDDDKRETLQDKWENAVKQSRYESGIEYSGKIGMLSTYHVKWHDRNFTSEDEAYAYLESNHQKFDPYGLAISFWSGKQIFDADLVEQRKKKIEQYDKEYRFVFAELSNYVIHFETMTCPNCLSVYPCKSFDMFTHKPNGLNMYACPACSKSMYTENTLEELHKQLAKAKEEKSTAYALCTFTEANKTKKWLIGGRCSS